MKVTNNTRKLIELTQRNQFRKDAPEILDQETAAAFLGISERMLIENLDALKIPHKKIGVKRIFSRAALVEWVNKD